MLGALEWLLWVDNTNSAHAIAVTWSGANFCDYFEVQCGPTRMKLWNDCFGWQQSFTLLS